MKHTLIALASLLILASCGNDREEMLAKERKEMKLLLNNNTSLLYKAIKLSFRSASSVADSSNTDKKDEIKNMKLQALAIGLLRNMLDKSQPAPGLGDYASAGTELITLRSSITAADEEQLPTLYENIIFISTGAKPAANGLTDPKWYGKPSEHLLLAAVWMASRKAPKEFEVYEAVAADPAKISDPLMKLGAEMVRAVVFFDQKWHYLAEDECTSYLNDIEKAGPSIGKEFSYPIFPEATINTPEAKYHQLHAAGLLMRGLCRHQSDREEEALEDYEDFIEDMGQGGVSNESVWLIGTYVSLKQEKPEEALKYLAQLEQSDMMGEREKKVLAEVKKYVSNRDSDKALNAIADKMFMAKITYHYTSSLLERTEGYKQLQENETGKIFLNLPEHIHYGYESMTAPAKSLIDLDSIGAGIDSVGNKAKNLVKDLFN